MRDQLGPLPVTVVVPVKNEEANLAACLERLGRFAEVLVVDSNSTDSTVAIAERFETPVVQFRWSGGFPKKRNWVLLNHRFSTEWVLFLDADELLDRAFCDEVASRLRATTHQAFWLNYTNVFMGRELRHGVPQRKLALFRVGSGLYERVPEQSWSDLDMEVHEHPLIEGSVGEIKSRIHHADRQGIEKFIQKHVDYARWEARRTLSLNADACTQAHFTARQRFKYSNIRRWWYPWLYFIHTYILRAGFLDGRSGFYYAFYKLWYFLTVRLMIAQKLQEPAVPATDTSQIGEPSRDRRGGSVSCSPGSGSAHL